MTYPRSAPATPGPRLPAASTAAHAAATPAIPVLPPPPTPTPAHPTPRRTLGGPALAWTLAGSGPEGNCG